MYFSSKLYMLGNWNGGKKNAVYKTPRERSEQIVSAMEKFNILMQILILTLGLRKKEGEYVFFSCAW